MVKDSKIKEFPDISNKLTAPTKKSIFEKQKAEAEAKRQREQEETAAVYEDFVKSFDDEDNGVRSSGGPSRGGGFGDRGGFAGFGKRHYSGPPAGNAGKSGLGGGRGSGPGSLGPPSTSLSRKRAYDGSLPTQREGLFAFEDAKEGPADPKTALQHSDDEDTGSNSRTQERAIPKPTIRLSSLPPGTSPAAIKAILPPNLTVDAIRMLPPSGPGTMERKSSSAVVTLAKDTPALDIDTVVSALQNRYMGRGFYLSLSRHLSSASIGLDTPPLGLSSSISSLPFGARPIPPPNLGRAPPGGHRGGFAPPSSYNSTQYGRSAPQVQVNVNPPGDLKQLKLIHKTLEALLTHGPEFEALLMSRKEVKNDEKWAWLWDSRSAGGVYYRWRLWDILTGASRRKGRDFSSSQHIFEGGAAWAMPDRGLPFEYATRLEELVSDSDYDSSEDEDSGDEGRRRYAHHHGGAPPPDGPSLDADNEAYLNPLQKAKLVHLLARLPTTNAKLRRGDVARVTAFAIQHAGEGAEEVVQMIVSNVQNPFAFTSANPDRQPPNEEKDDDPPAENTPNPSTMEKEIEDLSPAKLIALYLISDILSSSSTSGVRHAWRYRQLFEAALKRHKTFEHLGRLDKRMNWGRLRAEKWKRSVQSVLALWEGWCVFPQASQEHFGSVFANPPLGKEEEAAKMASEEAEKVAEKAKSRWKTVDEQTAEREAEMAKRAEEDDKMDVDGEPMVEDEGDVDGVPMEDEDEDVDGEPMVDSDDEQPSVPRTEGSEDQPKAELSRREALAASIAARLGKGAGPEAPKAASPAAAARTRRPKAADMFADSDSE
ncbi:hypothetical protein HO133_009809 [Letharia lupina]|uniref:CID domain-containing protein n=1 Tax=Letharia lupina TaxID=560253 RepID=A0A8H6CLZ7_9LECA|nr:uncharacterized protein HO133_009809 [Letharia lupina]KAF6225807.1 hypothetical protein HO133_009809 [Letharia lupina]